MIEEWRTVVGFEDYEVSTHGEVRSKDRIIRISPRERGQPPYFRRQRGHYLTPNLNGTRYPTVGLRVNSPDSDDIDVQTCLVHRVVAQAFIPNPDNLPVVRHLDHNPYNNRADNLAWGTYSENFWDKECPACGSQLHIRREPVEVEPQGREMWAPIVGWEGLYEVSTHGNVRSLDRIVTFTDPRKGTTVKRKKKGKVLARNKRGQRRYLAVSLHDRGNGRKRQDYCHRFVAEAFIPNPGNHPYVLHKDDNPWNPHVDNLMWGTPQDNAGDKQCPHCRTYIHKSSHYEERRQAQRRARYEG